MNQNIVTKQMIGAVFSTKKGLHEFLTVEVEIFLPPRQYTNTAWLRDIWAGKKKVIYTNLPFSLHEL